MHLCNLDQVGDITIPTKTYLTYLSMSVFCLPLQRRGIAPPPFLNSDVHASCRFVQIIVNTVKTHVHLDVSFCPSVDMHIPLV